MNRHIPSVLIVALFVLVALPSHATETHFRNARWGMTEAEVIETEGREPSEKAAGVLVYTGTVAGLDALIFYQFTDGFLSEGVYAIVEQYTNPNNHARDYDTLKDLLTEIYGEPESENDVWKNPYYRNRPTDERGRAASRGELIMYASWSTDSTAIQLLLGGENYRAGLYISYKSLQHQEESDRQRREELKQGL